ncbi:MAG: hypothetical protein PHV28_18700, partial [Kiritimatiellae bacterium]|nr:hypothetical protein [Kiritimatiellia bacterium]
QRMVFHVAKPRVRWQDILGGARRSHVRRAPQRSNKCLPQNVWVISGFCAKTTLLDDLQSSGNPDTRYLWLF